MKIANREILYTYTCGAYAGATSPHWHGSRSQPILNAHGRTIGTSSKGSGLCMTLPRALVWLVTGR